MPHRDPETGQFVSSAGHVGCYEDFDILHGMATHRIDAADLSGGEGGSTSDAPVALFDMGDFIDEHDVAEVVSLFVRGQAYGPTTATDESFIRAVLQLSKDPSFNTNTAVDGALGGANVTEDTIDTIATGAQDDEMLWQTVVYGITNHDDAANSEGGGGVVGESEEFIEYRNVYGGGPVLDDDDEVYAPVSIEYDNISDHRALAEIDVTMVVKEWDREECPVLSHR